MKRVVYFLIILFCVGCSSDDGYCIDQSCLNRDSVCGYTKEGILSLQEACIDGTIGDNECLCSEILAIDI